MALPRQKASSANSLTYAATIDSWETERKLLGYVQPHTAKKAAEKARLLLPWLGETKLDKIDSATIKLALIELGQHGGKAGKGLSSSTLRAVHLAGAQAIDWAIENGLKNANPFKRVARPKANHAPTQFLLPDQAARLASIMAEQMKAKLDEGKIQQASFALAVCIALATGMRRGEIFATEWSDIDSNRRRISISKAIKADGKLGNPKSESSVRSVAIGSNLLQLLKKMRAWQEENLPKKSWSQNNCVLCNNRGERANMNTFEHWWRAWADANGWPGLRFHDLRHSHATILIANGVDVKTTQMRLGHSSAEITLSIYAHAIPLADNAAAASMDVDLFG